METKRHLSTNLKDDSSLNLNGVYDLRINKHRNGNLDLKTIGSHPKVVLEFQNNEITQEDQEEELFNIIESFLNHLKFDDWGIIDNKGNEIKGQCFDDKLVILDKAKGRIIKEIIKTK